ncbi:MAG TPA: lysine--tRNA ligase [Fibrobacteria bacterium]|nr:lysine--tRNA ligase [Fibrobacteria bacterium]HOX52483.1 lysine--tRNA ligase [Fibrobacteria bacterium]
MSEPISNGGAQALTDQELARRENLRRIREVGVEPYPYRFEFSHRAADLRFLGEGKDSAQLRILGTFSLAGRVVAYRGSGKTAFLNLQDDHERIQVYLRKDDDAQEAGLVQGQGEAIWPVVRSLDLGDFIGVRGLLMRTKTGELTLQAVGPDGFELLSKSIKPLPFPKVEETKDETGKVVGRKTFQSSLFTDVEARYRQRYADLAVNPDVANVFRLRTAMIQEVRSYLLEQQFLEVETPTLQAIYGGASARPFVTHHNALDIPLYLRISNELYLKRLIAGGFDRVFEFVKDFRNEGIDRTHNPEFTQVEFYQAYADYNDMMVHFQAIWQRAAKTVLKLKARRSALARGIAPEALERECQAIQAGDVPLVYQGRELTTFFGQWERLPVKTALRRKGVDIDALSDDELKDLIRVNHWELDGTFSRGRAMMLAFEELCEPDLWEPAFVMDHPLESTPLCKVHRADPTLVERFEPAIAGMEVGNSYSELNDPIVQRRLLEEQVERGRGGEDETHPLDEDFLRAMEYGMPPMGGVGIGIDRMAMILTDQSSIRDVLLFPLQRPE